MNPTKSWFPLQLAGTRFLVPVFISLAAFATLATLAVSARMRRHEARKVEASKRSAEPGQASQPRFPIVLTNLTRFGFEPAAMKIPAGRCLLAVRNISGKEIVELQVKRAGASQTMLAEQHRPGKSHWEKFVEFGVGEYLLTEAGNPEWTLHLTVFPPGKQ